MKKDHPDPGEMLTKGKIRTVEEWLEIAKRYRTRREFELAEKSGFFVAGANADYVSFEQGLEKIFKEKG